MADNDEKFERWKSDFYPILDNNSGTEDIEPNIKNTPAGTFKRSYILYLELCNPSTPTASALPVSSYFPKRPKHSYLPKTLFRAEQTMVAGDLTITQGSPCVPGSIEMTPTSPSITVSSNEDVNSCSIKESEQEHTEDMICLRVKDVLGITPVCGVNTFLYNTTATFGDLTRDVAAKFQIIPGEFELVYQARNELWELSSMPRDEPLSAANMVPNRDKAYCVTINGASKKRGRKPKESQGGIRIRDDSDLLEFISSKSRNSNSEFVETTPARRDFVGLKNMNMTCYLNSLIQSLWFTPEFRNLVFKYIHEPGKFTNKSICIPLQKLFLKLQFSMRESIETDELTKTFGWNSRDTWHQHDIEELCNLLMEHLTAEFKDSDLDGTIEALYFGRFSDYVKCLECNNRNVNNPPFLVVPLPIKNFGSPLEQPTLECALKTFVTPETLDGNNKYNCGICSKPCDAHKGLIFKKLPYILSFQLKRFDFNYATGRRSKLNEKVVFPVILDMNPYIDRSEEGYSSAPDIKGNLVQPLKTEGQMDSRTTHSRPAVSLTNPKVDNDDTEPKKELSKETIGIGSSKELILEKLEETRKSSGPDVYQLYAVLVHRGGLTGGHYFAYILDFETYRWYRCDDSYVRKADVGDVEASFGGDEEDKEPTSAYMLMYRRYNPEINSLPSLFEEMPNHVQELWKILEEKEKSALDEEELEKNTIRISAHYRPTGTWDLISYEMNIPKSASTLEAAGLIHKQFFPDKTDISADFLRLCRLDKDLGIIENSFDGMNDQYLSYTLRHPIPETKNEGILLELKQENTEFTPYLTSDLVFISQVVDHIKGELVRIDEIHIQSSKTVSDLKKSISEKIKAEMESMFILLHGFRQQLLPLVGNDVCLADLQPGLTKVNHIFVGNVDPKEQSNFQMFVISLINTISVELEIHTDSMDSLNDYYEENDVLPNGDAVSSENHEAVNEILGNDTENETPLSTEITIKPNDVNSQKMENIMQCFRQVKIETRSTENNIKYCIIRVDGRMPLNQISQSLSEFLDLDENKFIIFKMDKEEEQEIIAMNLNLQNIAPFDMLRVRYGRRLKENEGRVDVHLLDLKTSPECPTFLGDVVLRLNMTTKDVKNMLLKKFSGILNGVDPSRLRIRKRNQGTPSKVFKAEGKVSDCFNFGTLHLGEIILQILEDTDPIQEHCYPLIVRHWKPSLLKLESPIETTLFYDHSAYIEEIILEKLPTLLNIPQENLEVAKPENSFPYNLNPIGAQQLKWFTVVYPAKRSLYVYNDELTLIVRDKTEKLAPISPEDEARYKKEVEADDGPYYAKVPYALAPPKKETGLKINLASSPTSS